MRNKIELNRRILELLQTEREIGDLELARMIRVSPSQIYRVKKGICSVGTDFIVGVLQAFPELRFEDLFYVER